MPKISNVSVRFSRRICPVQYEFKEAEVSINMISDENNPDEERDMEAEVTELFITAIKKTHQALGIAKTEVKKTPKPVGRPRVKAPEPEDTTEDTKKDTTENPKKDTTEGTPEAPGEDVSEEVLDEVVEQEEKNIDRDPPEDKVSPVEMKSAVHAAIKQMQTDGVPDATEKMKVYLQDWQKKCDIKPGQAMPVGQILSAIPEDRIQEFLKGLDKLGK